MKYWFLVFSLLCVVNINAQGDTVLLNVDVLGQPYPLTSYHHPVNGKYVIERNPVYEFSKKQLKAFTGFAYINPTKDHHVRTNYVQANSLRHFIDVSDMLYLQWGKDLYDTNVVISQKFIDSTKTIRREKYQELVQSYFNPFFIRRTEVTNYQYRQFVGWVRDSILMEEIFLNYPDFNLAKQVLRLPENVHDLDTNDRKIIRKNYNLNFDCEYRSEKIFDQGRIIRILKDFYLSPNERWYKRKELDVRNFKFSNTDSAQCVYPDTTTWFVNFPGMWNNPKTNMYFWHPGYDNFPVIGVSKIQAEMYCIWQQQQMKNRISGLGLPFDIELGLPSITDYENTVRSNVGYNYERQIEDNELVANLRLVENDLNKAPNISTRLINTTVRLTTDLVYIPSDIPKNKKDRKTIENFSQPWYSSYGNDLQFKKLMLQRIRENYIDKGIYFLSNNVSEWMAENYQDNYEELIKAYINYNCYSSIDYCEGQRIVDEKFNQKNDKNGSLVLGGNWYDERYGSYLGINKAGLYPKTFKEDNKSFATVGFRYVVRIIPK